jgi:hypothetical protein
MQRWQVVTHVTRDPEVLMVGPRPEVPTGQQCPLELLCLASLLVSFTQHLGQPLDVSQQPQHSPPLMLMSPHPDLRGPQGSASWEKALEGEGGWQCRLDSCPEQKERVTQGDKKQSSPREAHSSSRSRLKLELKICRLQPQLPESS